MFEQLEKEDQEGEAELATDRAKSVPTIRLQHDVLFGSSLWIDLSYSMEESANDIEGKWAHDKFEEMEASAMDNVVDMDTEV